MNVLGLTSEDWKKVGAGMGKAALALGSILLTGLFLPPLLLIPVGAIAGAALGYFVYPKGDAKGRKHNAIGFGIVGLAAGIGFAIASAY